MKNLSILAVLVLFASPVLAYEHSCHVSKGGCSQLMCAANVCDTVCKTHCKKDK
jgi:hypothetical protein